MDLETFLSRLDRVRHQTGGQYEARCPAHHDQIASLSVREGEHSSIVLTCHAGCDTKDVLAAMFLNFHDIAGEAHVVKEYPYTTEDGVLLYTIERWANPKTFRGVLPPQAERVPYNLMAVRWAREHAARIYICEGEKDVDRLGELHLPATCNPGGAGKWYDHYSAFLAGLDITIIADNDPPGRAHARAVAASVAPHARTVAVVVPRYGNDVSDLLDAGFTIDLLDPIPEAEGLGVIKASNVVPTKITWAWDGYVAFGKVTIFEGDPGDGKSVLTVDLVARWTSGLTMPDGTDHDGPYNAVMITAEDGPADTIVPRLIAAGADRERIYITTHGGESHRPFDVNLDMPELYQLVMKHNIKILTLDPLMAMVGEGTDTHNDASVRRGLFPLFQLAEDTGTAILVVRHLNKGTGLRAVYRGGGSIGFVGAARGAYTIGRDPDDRNRRIMANVKLNIGPTPLSLAYTIDQGPVGPYLTWHGPVDLDAQSVIDGDARSNNAEIMEFLNTVVQNGEPMRWVEIVKRGREEYGYTPKQLEKRRDRSRLVKIIGADGNSSARWGYLEHELAARNAKPSLHVVKPTSPTPPLPPTESLRGSGGNGEVGRQDPSQNVVVGPFPPQSHFPGEVGGEVGAPDDELSELERRDAELEALPLRCAECGKTEKITRYFKPYWVVRCRAHSPLVYKEKGIDE